MFKPFIFPSCPGAELQLSASTASPPGPDRRHELWRAVEDGGGRRAELAECEEWAWQLGEREREAWQLAEKERGAWQLGEREREAW